MVCIFKIMFYCSLAAPVFLHLKRLSCHLINGELERFILFFNSLIDPKFLLKVIGNSFYQKENESEKL